MTTASLNLDPFLSAHPWIFVVVVVALALAGCWSELRDDTKGRR